MFSPFYNLSKFFSTLPFFKRGSVFLYTSHVASLYSLHLTQLFQILFCCSNMQYGCKITSILYKVFYVFAFKRLSFDFYLFKSVLTMLKSWNRNQQCVVFSFAFSTLACHRSSFPHQSLVRSLFLLLSHLTYFRLPLFVWGESYVHLCSLTALLPI